MWKKWKVFEYGVYMSGKRKTKVKDIARKFDVPAAKVIQDLKELGVDVSSPSSEIDSDLVEIVEVHFTAEDVKKKKFPTKGAAVEVPVDKPPADTLHMKTPIVVRNLAELIKKKPNEIVGRLLTMNIIAGINQTIEPDVAVELCKKFNLELVVDKREKEEHVRPMPEEESGETPEPEYENNPDNMRERPPVVTFLGHVDHGKTSLQDYIRKTKVAAGESGGITQHIGASVISVNGKKITFIDTPGHEAFTAMRARGANVTDIAILVIAADDGFMPQTIEAMNHAKAAKVSIIVAINKMDLPTADPDKILRQMQQNDLPSEEWGGNVGTVRVSAVTGKGVQELLERILLEAEMLQLKADSDRPAFGVVLESQLEQGLGPTANVLVRNGTLKLGDPMICGECSGRVKILINTFGEKLKKADPSMPVKVVGLSGVPSAGSRLVVCKTEKDARIISEERTQLKRSEYLEPTRPGVNLEDIFARLGTSTKKRLTLVVKADAHGSIEAINHSLAKIPDDRISVGVIHSATGAITENDVLLASASNAIVVGFHVRVNPGVNTLAKKENVEIRLYNIIYELIEDIRDAVEGKLAPDRREVELGSAVILKIFALSKGPKVCGCMIEKGLVRFGSKARVFRDNELIFNGTVQSLRRFQDDVKEVRQGLECGIRLDNFDFQEGDKIQFYDIEFKKAIL